MRVTIVGGGIAGMATAMVLEQAGNVEYEVLEQAPAFSEIGAGVQIPTNGARVLVHHGLQDEMEPSAVRSEGTWYRDFASGELIHMSPLGAAGEQRYGSPYYQVHRAHLLDVLTRAVPTWKVRLNSHVDSVVQSDAGCEVRLSDGDTVTSDVVIAADGIHSTVRKHVVDTPPPTFSGMLAWRALIPRESLEGIDLGFGCHGWWGPGRSAVVFWCDGGERLNLVGIVPADEVKQESWTQVGDIDDFRASFRGACPAVERIVHAVDKPFITGIYDREPLETLFRGGVALIGDSAHPFLPYLANGATQALEDAHVIGTLLSRDAQTDRPVTETLREYEARRLARVTHVQQVSRDMEAIYHLADPVAIEARNKRLRQTMTEDPNASWMRDWLWGYDVIADTQLPLEESRAARQEIPDVRGRQNAASAS